MAIVILHLERSPSIAQPIWTMDLILLHHLQALHRPVYLQDESHTAATDLMELNLQQPAMEVRDSETLISLVPGAAYLKDLVRRVTDYGVLLLPALRWIQFPLPALQQPAQVLILHLEVQLPQPHYIGGLYSPFYTSTKLKLLNQFFKSHKI
jgi:hypothetical protein